MLTIFYDGKCPLCSAEMTHLKRYDSKDLILLVDLNGPDLQSNYPNIDVDAGMKILHGYYDGKILLGLEVTYRAWILVGKKHWVAPLNWPVIKPLSGMVYRVIARYRHPISNFLAKTFGIGYNTCTQGTCHDQEKNTHSRR
jgi:predicted DCC family thiol-disulfide oxidoreductase YuxK